MPPAWRNYQIRSAEFFRSIGLDVAIEHKVSGARGVHKIDVYVEGAYMGIGFKWVVECKSWKTNVDKEKVMALSAIIQDIGADRGFLLSEKGFQSGAIVAATKTNIALTNLDDLSSAVGDKFTATRIARLHLRIRNVQNKLRTIKKKRYDDEVYPPTMKPLMKVAFLAMAIDDALAGNLPTPYLLDGEKRVYANSLEELLEAAEQLVAEAENWLPPKED
jgi:hypothetical protein